MTSINSTNIDVHSDSENGNEKEEEKMKIWVKVCI